MQYPSDAWEGFRQIRRQTGAARETARQVHHAQVHLRETSTHAGEQSRHLIENAAHLYQSASAASRRNP